MIIRTKHIISVIIIFHSILGNAHAASNLEPEIAQLRTIDDVTGSAVYIDGAPGDFFKLSKIFLERGSEEDFLKLTEDESPVVRCMGLLCIAQNGKRIDVLKKHLTDFEVVDHFPGGCTGMTITVGNFSRKLLHDPCHMGHPGSHQPLLSDGELLSLDIEILSKDSTTSFHNDAREAIFAALKRNMLTLDLSDMKKRASNLETWQIIKVIGRLGVSPKTGRFLISCVRNKKIDDKSRLAAASALTCSKSEHITNIIERNTVYFNNTETQQWRDLLLQAAQIRISHEKFMSNIRAERLQIGPKGATDQVLAALSNNHPLVIPDLFELLAFAQDDESVRERGRAFIKEIVKNIDKCSQPWNTYSDTAYVLLFMLNERKWQFEKLFEEKEIFELETKIQTAIENHFEGKSEHQDSM